MHKTLLTIYFVFSALISIQAQTTSVIDTWTIQINTVIPSKNEIVSGNPGGNFDYVVNTSYTINGYVTFLTPIPQDATLYLRVFNSTISTLDTDPHFDIMLTTVKAGDNQIQINNTSANWDGQLPGLNASIGFPLYGYLYYLRKDQNMNQTPDYIALTPQYPMTAVYPNTSYCGAGAGTKLNGTVTGGISPYTYLWIPSSNLSSASIGNPVASPTATTTYSLQITDISKPIAQVLSQKVTVIVAPLPAPAITGVPIFYNPCAPSTSSSYAFHVGNLPSGVTHVNWSINNNVKTSELIIAYLYTGSLNTGIVLTGRGANGTSFTISCSYSKGLCNSAAQNDLIVFSNPSCMVQCDCSICPTRPGCIQPASLVSKGTLSISPNPTANGTMSLSLNVATADNYRIAIFNSYGNTVYYLDLGFLEVGYYSREVTLNEQGMYYLSVYSNTVNLTEKVLVN